MHTTTLPARRKNPPDRRFQSLMRVGDDQLHAVQPALGQAPEKPGPERLGLRGADMQPDDLPLAFGIHRHGDYGSDRNDATALALLEIRGIEPEIGPFARERAVEEGVHPLVDVLAELGNLR